MCGTCCRAFTVGADAQTLELLAQADESAGLDERDSAAILLTRRARKLTSQEALESLPQLEALPDWREFDYYCCSFVNTDGLCELEIRTGHKPDMCREYPNHAGTLDGDLLPPGCGYR
jgi:Fe-S-cluster containining protein